MVSIIDKFTCRFCENTKWKRNTRDMYLSHFFLGGATGASPAPPRPQMWQICGIKEKYMRNTIRRIYVVFSLLWCCISFAYFSNMVSQISDYMKMTEIPLLWYCTPANDTQPDLSGRLPISTSYQVEPLLEIGATPVVKAKPYGDLPIERITNNTQLVCENKTKHMRHHMFELCHAIVTHLAQHCHHCWTYCRFPVFCTYAWQFSDNCFGLAEYTFQIVVDLAVNGCSQSHQCLCGKTTWAGNDNQLGLKKQLYQGDHWPSKKYGKQTNQVRFFR